MTTQFQPPPTYADPVVVDEVTKKSQFSPIWLKWFLDIAAFISASGGGSGGGVTVAHNSTTGLQGGGTGEEYHFTAAEHTALAAFGGTHNGLTSIQGGSSTERYHLTATQATDLTAGFTGTGNLVRAAGATLSSPTLGVANATSIKVAAAGYIASDNTTGINASITTADLVGKTITVKDGIIIGYA